MDSNKKIEQPKKVENTNKPKEVKTQTSPQNTNNNINTQNKSEPPKEKIEPKKQPKDTGSIFFNSAELRIIII